MFAWSVANEPQCASKFDRETMNYFDYLCGVYEICFRTPAKLNAADRSQRSNSKDETKFYDSAEKPITENFMKSGGGDKADGATVNILGNSPFFPQFAAAQKFNHLTKSTQNYHNSDWDVVPKSCAGDWLLRYSQNETNFNPWHIDAKFSHFELVPWRRQQNKRIDLTNAIGWEPFKLTPATQNQLRTLQKFELARSKRLQKQRVKSQQQQRAKFRRQFKIRFIFALEVRQKRMKLFRGSRGAGGGTGTGTVNALLPPSSMSSAAEAATYRRKLVLQRDQQLYVFNARGYDLLTEQHWGYFSQRNKGLEEMLVKNNASQLDLSCMKECLTYYPAVGNGSSSISSKKSSKLRQQTPIVHSNSNSQTKQESQVSAAVHQQIDTSIISCEKCQSRCVIIKTFFLTHFSLKWLSLSGWRSIVRAVICTDLFRLSSDRKMWNNKYQHHICDSKLNRKVHIACVRARVSRALCPIDWFEMESQSIETIRSDPTQSTHHTHFELAQLRILNSYFGHCDQARIGQCVDFSFGSALVCLQHYAYGCLVPSE